MSREEAIREIEEAGATVGLSSWLKFGLPESPHTFFTLPGWYEDLKPGEIAAKIAWAREQTGEPFHGI